MKKVILPIIAVLLIAAGCNTTKTTENTEANNQQNSTVKTFINEKYKYQITHPAAATVNKFPQEYFGSKIDDTPEAAYQRLGGEVCITVVYENGYVTISAPENKDLNASCMRTGVGTEAKFSTENLTIENKRVTGDKIVEAFIETVSYTLADGTRIEIGGGGETDAEYQNYLKVKPELNKIAESYKKIN